MRTSLIDINDALIEKNLREALTRAVRIEYQTTCMAMLLVVVSTEAMDPTRESGPFRKSVCVSESLSMRVRGETLGSTSSGEGGTH